MTATATRRYIRAPHTLPSVGDHLVLATGRIVRVVGIEKVKIAAGDADTHTRGRTDALACTLECLETSQRWVFTHACERASGRQANELAGAAILNAAALREEKEYRKYSQLQPTKTAQAHPVIIAGSRTITDYGLLLRAVEHYPDEISEVVSGGAIGADTLGEAYAKQRGIPIRRFLPDWTGKGKRAGILRNAEMIQYAKERGGGLILLWDGESRGSADTLARARLAGISLLRYERGEFFLEVRRDKEGGWLK